MNEDQKRELANISVIAVGIIIALSYYVLIILYLVELNIWVEPFRVVSLMLPPLQFLVVPSVLIASSCMVGYIAIQKIRRKSGITLSWKLMAFFAFYLELSVCFIVAVYSMTRK